MQAPLPDALTHQRGRAAVALEAEGQQGLFGNQVAYALLQHRLGIAHQGVFAKRHRQRRQAPKQACVVLLEAKTRKARPKGGCHFVALGHAPTDAHGPVDFVEAVKVGLRPDDEPRRHPLAEVFVEQGIALAAGIGNLVGDHQVELALGRGAQPRDVHRQFVVFFLAQRSPDGLDVGVRGQGQHQHAFPTFDHVHVGIAAVIG